MKLRAVVALLMVASQANADNWRFTVANRTFVESDRPSWAYWLCDEEASCPTSGLSEGDLAYAKDTDALLRWDGSAWQAVGAGGGGGGAPTDATYITRTANGTLSAEQAMGALGTGLVVNTTTTGTPSIYAGTSCTNQFPRSLNASGAATCVSVAFASDVAAFSSADLSGRLSDETGVGAATFGAFSVRSTADISNTTTTFSNVTGLTWAAAASTVYTFDCQLSYVTAVKTTALQVSVNGPASPTAMRYCVSTATTATASHYACQNAYDAVTNAATGAAAVSLPVTIRGTVENGANAGTISIRLRSEIATSSVTVQRGAHCRVQAH